MALRAQGASGPALRRASASPGKLTAVTVLVLRVVLRGSVSFCTQRYTYTHGAAAGLGAAPGTSPSRDLTREGFSDTGGEWRHEADWDLARGDEARVVLIVHEFDEDDLLAVGREARGAFGRDLRAVSGSHDEAYSPTCGTRLSGLFKRKERVSEPKVQKERKREWRRSSIVFAKREKRAFSYSRKKKKPTRAGGARPRRGRKMSCLGTWRRPSCWDRTRRAPRPTRAALAVCVRKYIVFQIETRPLALSGLNTARSSSLSLSLSEKAACARCGAANSNTTSEDGTWCGKNSRKDTHICLKTHRKILPGGPRGEIDCVGKIYINRYFLGTARGEASRVVVVDVLALDLSQRNSNDARTYSRRTVRAERRL